MDQLVRDLRFALRRLGRSPGFAVIAVLSLTLGIGANTAIFSLVDAVLLRRSPMPQPERVLDVSSRTPDYPYTPFSYPEYRELREATPGVFGRISYAQYGIVPRDLGDRTATLPVELVNGDYFPLLGLRPRLGRLLGPEDDAAEGVSPIVVLSYDYWKEDFGGATNVIGRSLVLSGQRFTVVGVAPASYSGTVRGVMPSLYLPVRMLNQVEPSGGDELANRGNHGGFLKARLAPGVSMARVRVVAERFQLQQRREHPEEWSASRSIRLVPMSEVAVNPIVDGVVVPGAALIMGLVALVLLIACANLASFLLAQARDRQREVAIRLALGAGRATLVRQLLTEALLVAGLGGAAGVFFARLLLDWVLHADLPVPLPIRLDVPMDGRIALFALLVSVVSGLLFGLAPALQATRAAVVDTIKAENTGGGPARWIRVRDALVAGQVAVTLVLLIAAGLFLRSLLARQAADPGWGDRPAALLTILVPGDRYPGARAVAFMDRAARELAALPGVVAVGYTSLLPLDPVNSSQRTINIPGLEPPPGEPGFAVDDAAVDTGYLAAASIPILQGRNFSAGDIAGAPRVAIVTGAMARRFWPGRDPVGQTFRADTQLVHIIGVARDIKVGSLGEAPRPYIFFAAAQSPVDIPTLVVRTRNDAAPMVARALATLHGLDRHLPVFRAMTARRYLASLSLPARLASIAVGALALLALTLAIIGIWGVVRYAVARRSREVAIRMALGADPRGVVRLLTRHGAGLVGAGAAAGLALGLAGARLMRAFLFGISPFDPVTFAAVPLLLVAVGLLAAFLPARRAGRLEPMRALRGE